jgi:NADP-dependent 3-hydroxy acid dehydrogenase YdfG
MKVQDRVIVVTGGGNGIGRELVLHLLSRGASVAAVDRDEAGLKATADLAVSPRLSTHVVNLIDRAAVEALPAAVIAKHGAVDGIINNAGIIQPFVRLNELGYDAIDRVFDVNWRGTLHMTKAFLPHLLARPVAHIANISSMGGFLPVPGQTVYGASKAAVKLFTEGLRSELRDTKVGVTVVFPGAVGTNIAQNSGLPAPKEGAANGFTFLAPAEAARQIVAGIEAGRYRVLVGKDAWAMDLLVRVAPGFAADFIYRQMKGLLG